MIVLAIASHRRARNESAFRHRRTGPRLSCSGGGKPPPRVPAERSDLLTHSPLAACSTGDAPCWRAEARAHRHLEHPRRAFSTCGCDRRRTAGHAGRRHRVAGGRRTRASHRFRRRAADLATSLRFHYVFAASIKWDEGDYGLAVLSRWPPTEVRRHRLDATAAAEPRIVLEVTVCAGGRPLRIFNHHADGHVASRDAGFAELREIVQPHVGHGILVLGDFNEHPDAPGVRRLIDAGLVDLGAERNVNTAHNGRIDYMLADGPLSRRASTARVWPTDKSDHNAVLVDLEW